MLKLTLSMFFIFCVIDSNAQYYYKDIVGTKETSDHLKMLVQHKVNKVTLSSTDPENRPIEDFFVEQSFSGSHKILKTVTRAAATEETILFTFLNENNQLSKTIDSSKALITTTSYSYTPDGSLEKIVTEARDSSNKFTQTEEHIWKYANGRPVEMLRIKNKFDTSFISLKLDERGNVIEERSERNGIKSEPVFYYYDDENRLTDIVRYNNKVRKLLPEYMFEYGSSNQVIQKITVPANSSQYTIWRYQYDNRGLKTREAVYDRSRKLTGKIEYRYF